MWSQSQPYSDFYKEVFEKYSQSIFSYILNKVGKKMDALDIGQNVFIHLWKYRKKLRSGNAESIIFKSCKQEIFKFYKHLKNRGESVSLDTLEIQIADYSEQELEEKMEKERMLNEIYEALNVIPAQRKQIFLLNKIEGKTRKEIAMEMNVSKSAVGNQIDKVMHYLKNKFR